MTTRQLNRICHMAAELAGLPKWVSPRTLRHSFATHLLEQNIDVRIIHQRSQEALKQKARRGALFLGIAAGYVKTGRERIEKDPDQRVQDALRLVFTKFAQLQSVHQVHVWLRDEGIALLVKSHDGEDAA